MIRALQMKTLLLCSLLLLAALSHAQGWMKKYSPDRMMAITSVYPTPDSGCKVTGYNLLGLQNRSMKIDKNGNGVWAADNDSLDAVTFSNITQDGGFVTLGWGKTDNQGMYTRVMVRTDANGQKLWSRTIHTFAGVSGNIGNADVDTTLDGGLVFMLTSYDTLVKKHILFIKKLQANGDLIWENTYFNSDTIKYGFALRNTPDGGYIAGILLGPTNNPGASTLFKIDGAGNLLWSYEPQLKNHFSLMVAKDGNILLTGIHKITNLNSVVKLTQNGNELWQQTYPELADSSKLYGAVVERDDNTLACITAKPVNSVDKFTFCIFDTLGNILHAKKLPSGNLGYNVLLLRSGYKTFAHTADNGYLLGGWAQNDPDNYSAFLIKMDSAGNVYPSILHGNTFYDDNQNCTRDSNEPLINPVPITFTGTSDTFTVITQDSGYYKIGLNNQNYAITVTPPSPYWQPSACNAANINMPAGTVDSTMLFGLKPIVYSPYITISGGINRLRACLPSVYTARYCNTGTAPFTGILILDIDTLLHVDSASAPIITNNGSKYYFLVPQLDAMQCATLNVYCTVSCSPDFMGQAVCIEAHAEQDTVINVSPLWDHSNLEIQAMYVPAEDSVTFTLHNKGNGDMSHPKSLLVIEDNVILLHTPVQLPAGATILQKVPANGSTWRGTIEQTEFNPYSKFVTAAVEAAGTNQQGGVSLGYFLQYPINGYYGYNYNTCGTIRNSFDPNEKIVVPTGAGTDKLIDSTTELEYTLYFQNTGNDTAYQIRLTDTLASYLNPATLRAGASSHPYRMELLPGNVLQFNFVNINLPDSGSNQTGSNGYVKFTIKQKPGNTAGTVINNKVDIYFDFNPPVTTNTATVRIGKVLPTSIQTLYKNKPINIQAYPNPFTASARINIEGETFDKLQLTVYDLTGRIVKQQLSNNTNSFTITNDNLQAGTYIFEISSNNQPVGRGKLIVQ